MKRIKILILALTLQIANSYGATNENNNYDIKFNQNNYEVKTLTINGQTIKYRAFEKIVYVKNPVDTKYEIMNFYVPEDYYLGKKINGYKASKERNQTITKRKYTFQR